MSATSQGGGLFDPYRVGDASFPFFLERGIPSEFVLIGSLIIVLTFYETPLGPSVFCSFFCPYTINILLYRIRRILMLQKHRTQLSTAPEGSYVYNLQGRWLIRPLQGRRCFLSFFSGTWNSFGINFGLTSLMDICITFTLSPLS